VAQELSIREEDCQREGDPYRGLWMEDVAPDEPGKRTYLETRVFGRTLAVDVTLSKDNPHEAFAGRTLKAGELIDEAMMEALRDDPEVNRVRVRSALACQSDRGRRGACDGRSARPG